MWPAVEFLLTYKQLIWAATNNYSHCLLICRLFSWWRHLVYTNRNGQTQNTITYYNVSPRQVFSSTLPNIKIVGVLLIDESIKDLLLQLNIQYFFYVSLMARTAHALRSFQINCCCCSQTRTTPPSLWLSQKILSLARLILHQVFGKTNVKAFIQQA